MSKNVCFLISNSHLPYYDGNGDSVLIHAIINLFLDIEYTVDLFVLGFVEIDSIEKSLSSFVRRDSLRIISIPLLKKSGIVSDFISFATFSNLGSFYNREDILKVEKAIGYKFYDLYSSYSNEATLVLASIKPKNHKVAFLVDLLQPFYNRRWEALKQGKFGRAKIINLLSYTFQNRNIKVLENAYTKIDAIIEHSEVHFNDLKKLNLNNLFYFPHPLPIKKYRKSYPVINKKFRILLIGSFKGVASKLGQLFFLEEILPILEDKFNNYSEKIEFRFVGHGVMRSEIKEQIEASSFCRFVGFVEEIEEEWFYADLVLVTVPIPHGFRTRIAEAFNYEKCVLAHTANKSGMPELIDNYNCILSENGMVFAEKIISLYNNPNDLKAYAKSGKETFVNSICADAAKGKLKNILNNLSLFGE